MGPAIAVAVFAARGGPGHTRHEPSGTYKGGNHQDQWVTFGQWGEEANQPGRVYHYKKSKFKETETKKRTILMMMSMDIN